MAVGVPSNLNANLVREYWDTNLQMESLFRDVFSALRTKFDRTKGIDIPKNTLTLEINAQANEGYRQTTVGWLHALDDAPRYGDLQNQIGFEETLREKSQLVYFNEISHAVALYNYGIHFHDHVAYQLNMDKASKMLGNYMEELFGLHYRQALLQRLSVNLTFSPIFQTQRWNPRWFIKNAATQPAYNTTLQTHTNNIANALIAAGTGQNATLDANYMNALHWYITSNRIEPLEIGGSKGYILTVPTNQKYHALNLERADSMANYFTSVNRFNDKERSVFPEGACLGKWLDIYLVEDERAPTLTIGGTAAPFTLTPGYVHPGSNDQRDTSTGARDIGFLLGNAPLIDYYPVNVHHKYDDQNYQKWEGKGAFCMRGVNLRMYDNVTATNTSWEQRYCIVCAFARSTIRA